MVMALFCFTVARARAMFAELLVWFAEPARSCAPHFDGAHFSSMGLSDTGPFKVWAEALVAKDSRIAARTAERTMECLMDISSSWGVSGQNISFASTEATLGLGGLRARLRGLRCIVPHPLVANTTLEFATRLDAEGPQCSIGVDAFFLEESLWLATSSNTPNFPLPLPVPGLHRVSHDAPGILPTIEASRSSSARPRSEARAIFRASEGGRPHGRRHRQDALPAHGRGHRRRFRGPRARAPGIDPQATRPAHGHPHLPQGGRGLSRRPPPAQPPGGHARPPRRARRGIRGVRAPPRHRRIAGAVQSRRGGVGHPQALRVGGQPLDARAPPRVSGLLLRQPPQDRSQRARPLPREPALRPHRRVLRALRRGVLRSPLPERADDHLRASGASRPAPRLDTAKVETAVHRQARLLRKNRHPMRSASEGGLADRVRAEFDCPPSPAASRVNPVPRATTHRRCLTGKGGMAWRTPSSKPGPGAGPPMAAERTGIVRAVARPSREWSGSFQERAPRTRSPRHAEARAAYPKPLSLVHSDAQHPASRSEDGSHPCGARAPAGDSQPLPFHSLLRSSGRPGQGPASRQRAVDHQELRESRSDANPGRARALPVR